MDGVIFDSVALYRDAVINAAAERGLDMPPPLYLSTIGLPGEATRDLLGRHSAKTSILNLSGRLRAAISTPWLKPSFA
jgi:beta-phosphoglucomutase-like phosphatase (HAD superfamily)